MKEEDAKKEAVSDCYHKIKGLSLAHSKITALEELWDKAASKEEVSWDEAYSQWHIDPEYNKISFPDWIEKNYKLIPKQ